MVRPNDMPMMERLRAVARHVIPANGQAWLYGSRARGEAREDTDWDILILLPQMAITTQDDSRVAYPFVEEGWRNGAAVNTQVYTYEEWQKRDFTQYHHNVEHDKISLL